MPALDLDVSLETQNEVIQPVLLALAAVVTVWRTRSWRLAQPALGALELGEGSKSASLLLPPKPPARVALLTLQVELACSTCLLGMHATLLALRLGAGGAADAADDDGAGHDGDSTAAGDACAVAAWALSTALVLFERSKGLHAGRSLRLWWLAAFLGAVVRLRSDVVAAKGGSTPGLHLLAFAPAFALALCAVLTSDSSRSNGYDVRGLALPVPVERWAAEHGEGAVTNLGTAGLMGDAEGPAAAATAADMLRTSTAGADEQGDDASLFRASSEASASMFERLTFWWFNGVMARGAAEGHFLEASDLHQLQSRDATGASHAALGAAWAEKRPSFFRALARAFGPYFAVSGLFKLVNDCIVFVNPMLISGIVSFVEAGSDEPASTGYFYAGMMLAAATVESLNMGQYFFRGYRLAYRARSAIAQAVFEKALRLTYGASREFGEGAIVSFMQIDADKLANSIPYLHLIWSAPLQLAICLWLLYGIVGPAAFAGLGVLVLLMPLNTFVAKKQMRLTKATMEARDRRVKLTNEVVVGVRVVKLCAWEAPLLARLDELREVELSRIRANALWGALSTFLWGATPLFVTCITFALFAALRGAAALTAAKAFTSLALFNLLRFPLNAIPSTISRVIDLSVVVRRLGRFLDAPELGPEERAVHATPAAAAAAGGAGERSYCRTAAVAADGDGVAIRLRDAAFAWPKAKAEKDATKQTTDAQDAADDAARLADEAEAPLTIGPLNLSVRAGELLGVAGPVGCGKSSFLSALVNEIPRVGGSVAIAGERLAFCAQSPWIQNATVRDNVLFSRAFDQRRYDAALDACALRDDLAALPAGDATEIGERGNNLSGGQKARVALARAVYADADVYLLDDVLSAVDAHVCEHLMDRCVGVGLGDAKGKGGGKGKGAALDGRTRVLATHHVRWLQRCDRVLVFGAGGEELACGRPSDPAVKAHLGASLDRSAPPPQAETADPDATAAGDAVQPGSPKKAAAAAAVAAAGGKGDGKREGAAKGNLITKEDRQKGVVKGKVWATYSRAFGKGPIAVLVVLYLASQGLQVGSSGWLDVWSAASAAQQASSAPLSATYYVGIYAGLSLGGALFILLRAVVVSLATVKAGRRVHGKALVGLLGAPTRFFDSTPVGRIINRFSNDQQVVDIQLRYSTSGLFLCVFSILGVLCIIIFATPYIAACLVPMFWLYNRIAFYYRQSSRELQRLDSISKSPVYQSFSEVLAGATTIRAFGPALARRFEEKNAAMLDRNIRCSFASQTANRWLAIRLEFIGNLLIGLTAVFIILEHGSGSITAGVAGLALSYVINFTSYLNWLIRVFTSTETQMVNVERLHHFGDLEPEEDDEAARRDKGRPALVDVDGAWPRKGALSFRDVRMRYSADADEVLRGVTFEVAHGEKIGIVGRTGAGKSSMLAALFRMVTPDLLTGTIEIDGVGTDRVSLHTLRSRLAVIPQDPVLFSGTMRSNIDPFGGHSDDELWEVLRQCEMAAYVRDKPEKLAMVVEGAGANLSVGQRQLVCLARALLRRARIVVLDEATAAIDSASDAAIQKTLRDSSAGCALLTVAHRLETILDYDKVLVLDQGRVTHVLKHPFTEAQIRAHLGR